MGNNVLLITWENWGEIMIIYDGFCWCCCCLSIPGCFFQVIMQIDWLGYTRLNHWTFVPWISCHTTFFCFVVCQGSSLPALDKGSTVNSFTFKLTRQQIKMTDNGNVKSSFLHLKGYTKSSIPNLMCVSEVIKHHTVYHYSCAVCGINHHVCHQYNWRSKSRYEFDHSSCNTLVHGDNDHKKPLSKISKNAPSSWRKHIKLL